MSAALPLKCPDCGARMRLVHGTHGMFYGCAMYSRTGCKGAHGAHQTGVLAGQPLGVPGDAATRAARERAHRAFDQLWMNGRLSRIEAYRWMRRALRLTKREAHIGSLTIAQCDELITHVQAYLRGKLS